MGKFLGSLDGIGVLGVAPARAKAKAPVRLAVSADPAGVEVRARSADAARSPAASPPLALPSAPVRSDRDAAAAELSLTAIRDEIGDCKRCRLCEGRNKIVFGQGNPVADLMFVGEAPGADEDAQGLAFVGRAGQLLTDMVEKGMRIQRSDVFIANVIKCRPPGNRPPENDEITTCQPFLEAQIKAVRPRVIVALGATAGKFMAKTGDPIARFRGRFASWDDIPVMPTYHPAYLLRTPSAKKTVWEDLKLVMDVLGTPAD
ncbi:MAG: uracil-DNA glycosylase [Vicinamibacteria bacterium]|nr:uracil-DNA glycosylase [Vicinamibacteria bacterium]